MKIIWKVLSKIYNIFYHKIFLLFGNIEWVWPKFRIPSTRNINVSDNFEYKNPFLKYSSSSSFELVEFLIFLNTILNSKKPFSLIRMGDSEMLFLQGNMVGNIVNRSFLNDDISNYDLKYWKKKMLSNDCIMLFHRPSMLKLMPVKVNSSSFQFKFDLQIIYQLTASKLLFLALKGKKIGIIGAKEKVDLISALMEYKEYQEYLGVDSFVEYIGIPQKGASADYEKTQNLIEEQMTGSADVYLVGMSVAKLVILPNLRDKFSKVFLDIGVGIDAIAGVIPNTKSYFGDWVNYRIPDYDYSNINFFVYQNGVKKKVDNLKYLGGLES